MALETASAPVETQSINPLYPDLRPEDLFTTRFSFNLSSASFSSQGIFQYQSFFLFLISVLDSLSQEWEKWQLCGSFTFKPYFVLPVFSRLTLAELGVAAQSCFFVVATLKMNVFIQICALIVALKLLRG